MPTITIEEKIVRKIEQPFYVKYITFNNTGFGSNSSYTYYFPNENTPSIPSPLLFSKSNIGFKTNFSSPVNIRLRYKGLLYENGSLSISKILYVDDVLSGDLINIPLVEIYQSFSLQINTQTVQIEDLRFEISFLGQL